MKIAIIDYGVGNLGSVTRSVEEIKATPILAKSPLDLHLADSLILPGVGNFTECINILKKDGWDKVIIEEVIQKKKTNSWYMFRYATFSDLWIRRFKNFRS